MSWIDRVRNALPFIPKRETPDNLWHKCPSCGQMIFNKEYEENLSVCPQCGHHGRIGPDARFAQIFDDGYDELETPKTTDDPLKFRDSKKYSDRLKDSRIKTEQEDTIEKLRAETKAIEGMLDAEMKSLNEYLANLTVE